MPSFYLFTLFLSIPSFSFHSLSFLSCYSISYAPRFISTQFSHMSTLFPALYVPLLIFYALYLIHYALCSFSTRLAHPLRPRRHLLRPRHDSYLPHTIIPFFLPTPHPSQPSENPLPFARGADGCYLLSELSAWLLADETRYLSLFSDLEITN